MSHLEEVSARVDAAIAESVIAHMNELLIALSDDAELRREDRYVQQQRLRTAIAHHGRQYQEDRDARREQLTKGGTILYHQPDAGGDQKDKRQRLVHQQASGAACSSSWSCINVRSNQRPNFTPTCGICAVTVNPSE